MIVMYSSKNRDDRDITLSMYHQYDSICVYINYIDIIANNRSTYNYDDLI